MSDPVGVPGSLRAKAAYAYQTIRHPFVMVRIIWAGMNNPLWVQDWKIRVKVCEDCGKEWCNRHSAEFERFARDALGHLPDSLK